MITEWPYWWCCLKPSWRDMFNYMGTFSALPDPMVFRWAYDANFEALIAPKSSWLYDWFNTSFEITFAEVDIPLIGLTEMALWPLTDYASFILWQGDPGYACPDPCPYTTGYFALP